MKSGTQPPPQNRRVGLDKPCRICGQPIYFNYQGPLEGVCGKCVDKARGGSRKGRPRNRPHHRSAGGRRHGRFGALLFAFLLGAAAGYLLHPLISLYL